jgi:cytochrome b561
MALKNTTETYGAVARWMHWATAFIVIGLLCVGLYMSGLDPSPAKLALYGLHKSFGTLVLAIVALRILWKGINPHPHPLPNHARWEVLLARFIHACLYLALVGMPLSGWIMTGAADFPHTFFNLFTVPDIVPGKNEALFKLMREAHELCANALIGAVALHFAGALKHHIVDRDDTLRRMLPARAALSLGFILLVLGGLTAFYYASLRGHDAPAAPHAVAPHAALAPAAVTETIVAAPAALDDAAGTDAVPAPSWVIDPQASRAEFSATVDNVAFTGTFTGMTGTILFDPGNLPGSRADVTVRIDTVQSGSAERDSSMVQPAWFDAESFPESRFVSTAFESLGGNRYVAHGRLTIRDVTLPVDLPFTLDISTDSGGNKIANMQGTFDLQRLDYGVGQGDWAGTGMVANPVNVRVFVTARAGTP